MSWSDMASAPTDGTRILLLYDRPPLTPASTTDRYCVVVGWRENERLLLNPRPFWRCDREQVWGRPYLRATDPVAWHPIPSSEYTT